MNYKSKLLKKHLSSDETDESNKDNMKGGGGLRWD
jgi:hypothetical protein